MTPTRTPMPAALLCGGDAERLGYPKEMLRVDGAPLAVRLVERLREAFDPVAVISNRPEFLAHCLDAPIHRDEFPGAGPLAGLHAGLKHAGAERCFFLACDMPLVHNALIERIVQRALRSDAPAVIAAAGGRRQPLCGVYAASLVPALERRLAGGEDLSANGFLDEIGPEIVEFEPSEAGCFRDVDAPEDLGMLREAFEEVEPLPVRTVPVPASGRAEDVVVEEWPAAVHVNGHRLVTVLCLPAAWREMAVGLAAYFGLVRRAEDVRELDVDYGARRIAMELDVTDDQIRSAAQILITSTCGASVYGGLTPPPAADAAPDFRVTRTHVLECLKALRGMAPAFSRTGATHQAAFSDGGRIRLFFEDIGRHNATDKVIGSALLSGIDLGRGVLMSTGRLSSEMVVKAARQAVPVLASPSAVTTNAIRLAEECVVTLVGFARGGRANVYTRAERVSDE